MKNFFITLGGILIFIAMVIGGFYFLRNFNKHASVILTSPCDPPCWYGIKPGQSNSWEVYESLYQLEGLNIESVHGEYDQNERLVSYYWFFQRPIEDSSGSIHFENDRVTSIEILTVNSLTLANLFEKLGEPEVYWKELGYGEEREYLDVILFYPTKGYLAEVILETKYGVDQVEIRESAPVFRVVYFDPEMYEELLDTKILINKATIARTGSFQPWLGYGAITFGRE